MLVRWLIDTGVQTNMSRTRAASDRLLCAALSVLLAFGVSAWRASCAAAPAPVVDTAQVEALRHAMHAAHEHAKARFEIAKDSLDSNFARKKARFEFDGREQWKIIGIVAIFCAATVVMAWIMKRYYIRSKLTGAPIGMTVVFALMSFSGMFVAMLFAQRFNARFEAENAQEAYGYALESLKELRDGSSFARQQEQFRYGTVVDSEPWYDLVAAGATYYEARAAYHRALGVDLKPFDHGPPDAPPRH